jgi:hypothetical protein
MTTTTVGGLSRPTTACHTVIVAINAMTLRRVKLA